MGTAAEEERGPVRSQDRNTLAQGETKRYEIPDRTAIDIDVSSGSVELTFLDPDDDSQLGGTLELQAGEDWDYNFWLDPNNPDVVMEGLQSGDNSYVFIQERV